MRLNTGGSHEGVRSSALWGGGPKSKRRTGALWGGVTHSVALVAVFALALTVGVSVSAAGTSSQGGKGGGGNGGYQTTYGSNGFGGKSKYHSAPGNHVPGGLIDNAAANPNQTYRVIIQTNGATQQKSVGAWAAKGGAVNAQLGLIHGVTANISGDMLFKLSQDTKDFGDVTVTPDLPVMTSAATPVTTTTAWQDAISVNALWSPLGVLAPQAPAIAIVDSGIDATRTADFGSRVIARADFVGDGATGDPEGHGTMVAGVAAGASNVSPGVAQNAPLVDVRVADGQGLAYTSNVIAGLNWILQHKAQYHIGVANMSLAGNAESSFLYDPLDQAVEKLWLNGVVVVAAAGNNGVDGAPVPLAAPGNDPFVITVGAVDTNGTKDQSDDFRAPWSAYGHTADGFAKPELTAPGRIMVGPISTGSYIYSQVPDRQTSPGYMWMSGTSFAAPVVAGAAAQLLAIHPSWTPDQVKGALMYTAQGLSDDGTGIGEINAARAATVLNPPNPNAGLNTFVSTDPTTGLAVFSTSAWTSAASTSSAWTSSAWTSSAWTSSAWTSSAWTSSAWTSSAWTSSAWTSSAWTSSAWTSSGWVS
jgi:serine protease AprX